MAVVTLCTSDATEVDTNQFSKGSQVDRVLYPNGIALLHPVKAIH